jgi:hypothetical protein
MPYLMVLLICNDFIASPLINSLHISFVKSIMERYARIPIKHDTVKIIQMIQQNILRNNRKNSIIMNNISPTTIHWAQFWIVVSLTGSFDRNTRILSASSRGKRVWSNSKQQWDYSQKNSERCNSKRKTIA